MLFSYYEQLAIKSVIFYFFNRLCNQTYKRPEKYVLFSVSSVTGYQILYIPRKKFSIVAFQNGSRNDDSTVSSILSGLETRSLGLNTLGTA